jgi:biotin carboxyl carrier protein
MKREFSVTLDGTAYKVLVDGNTVLVNGQPFSVALDAGAERVTVDGTPYEVKLAPDGKQVVVGGISYGLSTEGLEVDPGAERGARRAGGPAAAASAGAVTAIMPGKIIRIVVAEGEPVAEGQVVCILEAMKMENELKAPRAGVLKTLHVRPGQDVERGAVLAEIE